mgnify:CR=1 FL=1
MGSIFNVHCTQGLDVIRYGIISATDRNATAQVDGDNDTASIDIGNIGTLVEDDVKALSTQRFKRKRLA